MTTRIQKVGDGLAFLIPPGLVGQPGFADNAEIDVTVENGAMVARPITRLRTKYTLADALAGITDDNIHPETDTGPAVGNEVW